MNLNHQRAPRANLTFIGSLLSLLWIADGQSICACAPSSYEFVFNFNLTCPPVNVTEGNAVAATSCLISPFGNPAVTDLVPVAVESIEILELDQNLQISVQEKIQGNFANGDSFKYVSVAANPSEIPNPVDIPRAIQLNTVALNQFDQSIIAVYIITFTNNCGAYPVLFDGQSAGWTVFVSISHICH